ncbi:MAG: hemolysin [Saprospiraceae bacterium]|nr:MAG: hemolysin [Saprospiraceae bacterium]
MDENLEIRSEEVQEILGTPPSWLVQWGTIIALIIIVILGWISYFVQYPDTVTGQIRVTSTEPPRKLVAERMAYISKVLVSSEDTVEAGQVLLVFKSKAKFEDVLSLEDYMLSIKDTNDSTLLSFNPPKDLILGELQDDLYDFKESRESYDMSASRKLDKLSIEQLKSQIRKARNNIVYEKKQKENYEKQLKLSREELTRQQNLLKEGLNSVARVRQVQEKVLSDERMIQGFESNIKNKEFEISLLQREIGGYEQGANISQSSASAELRESFYRLQEKIEDWKKDHLLISPMDGLVVLNNESLGAKQFVAKETELMLILPTNTTDILGRLALEHSGTGKVKEGQRVVVKFDSYPFEEFGAVIGQVSRKGKVPNNDRIPIEVIFPDGLRTTTGRVIEPSQEMLGKAEIITENKRFIDWIFENTRKLVSIS